MSTDTKGPTIRDYLKAGFPCLFLRTIDPQVAENRVKDALMELGMADVAFGVWKATTGLMIGRVDGTVDMREAQRDLLDALAYVETAEHPVAAVFHNVRQFVNNYQIIQQLSDAIFASRLVGSHIILVGPMLDLPPELKNFVQYIDIPLPTRDDIAGMYNEMIRAYSDEMELPDGPDEVQDLIRVASTAAVGLDMMGAENAIALSMASTDSVDVKIIQAQKEQEVRKSDVLEFFPTEETIDNLGGFGDLKHWLNRRRRVFTDEARKYGLPYPKGMLVVGPAGTGKSLCAKAVSSYLQLPLLRLDMGKVFRSLMGESEAAIRLALQVAEAVSPVVLWMDEIEKGLAGMRGSGELDSGVTARVVSTILTWRQETRYPVMVMATSNDVATLPSMVYRKGRLDEVWATDLPFETEREEIFRIHLRKRNRDPKKFDCALLASKTKDFVGAEIEGCIEEAMFTAFDQDAEVKTSHIARAIRETIPQAQRDKEELKAIREWVKTRARLVSGNGTDTKQTGKVRKIKT